jgi:UDP-glucose 4-epimerase
VHVVDIAQAHIAALNQLQEPGSSAYNIGTGRSFSVREVLQAVERGIGMKVPVVAGDRRPGDPAILEAKPDKLIKDLHWTPQHSSLDNIIATAWAWKTRMLAAASH